MTILAENNQIIQSYAIHLKREFGDSKKSPFKISTIQRFLEVIANDPRKYDIHATLNIEWRGNELLDTLKSRKTDEESIDDLFEILSRIAREVTLKLPYIPKEPEKLFLDYYAFGNTSLNDKEKANSDFIWASMPKYIAMEQMGFLSAEQKNIDAKISSWRKTLETLEAQVSMHEANLKKHSEHYNFVGLSKAFSEMLAKKTKESRMALLSTIVIGLLSLSPLMLPLFTAGRSAISTIFTGPIDASAIAQMLSMLTLEIVLIYFFRVALHNWQSLRAQALQLELRKSLCAFIEGYTKFTRENERSAQSLAKFESLIFSGLIAEPGQLPSTFDGLDAMARLLKEVRAKT